MTEIISRRGLLAGIGYTAACGSLASQLVAAARAGEAAAPASPEIIMSMVFMGGAKSKLDIKRYTTKHLPLLRKTYGDSVSRIEFRQCNATARGVPSDVIGTTSIYISDLGGFAQKMQAGAADVQADLDQASKGTVLTQIDRLALAMGEARSEVRVNNAVFSTYFWDKPDATFDGGYYSDVYLPKLRSLYGDNAIRRIEFNTGMVQGGRKPTFLTSAHLFIRERSAYDSANGEAMPELMKTDTKYTNAVQMYADSKVNTIV